MITLTSTWEPYISSAQCMSNISEANYETQTNGYIIEQDKSFIKMGNTENKFSSDYSCDPVTIQIKASIWLSDPGMSHKHRMGLKRSYYDNNCTAGIYWPETACYNDSCTAGTYWPKTVLTPGEKLRQMIQARQAPLVIGTRKSLAQDVDERERRARDTLRRLVGEVQYRRFLLHGFITARGKSGKVYQIRPGHAMTTVYSPTGEPIEKLCIVLSGNFPPTDELITRFLMILNDEEHFRSLANVFKYFAKIVPEQSDRRPLPEIFAALKGQAA